jgi:membrane-associated protease RseP (regulator of RpoE activity)
MICTAGNLTSVDPRMPSRQIEEEDVLLLGSTWPFVSVFVEVPPDGHLAAAGAADFQPRGLRNLLTRAQVRSGLRSTNSRLPWALRQQSLWAWAQDRLARPLIRVCSAATIASAVQAQTVDLPALGSQPYIVEESGKRVALYDGSYALLISERRYLGVAQSGWRPLESTPREMDQVAASLRRHGFVVRRATDLSGQELTSAFRDFMAEFGHRPNHRLLFFFSGHGYTNPLNDMGYIVPIDALDPNTNPTRFYSRAIPIETIQTWAREMSARHVLFVFDSCFSGSIFLSRAATALPTPRGTSASDRLAFFRGSSTKPVRQFIAAGGPKEELPAVSTFVPLFLQAIDGQGGRSGDGYVTGKELGLWLEQNVPRFRPAQNPHSGIIKQPELAFGDMVFQPPFRNETPTAPPPINTAPRIVQSVWGIAASDLSDAQKAENRVRGGVWVDAVNGIAERSGMRGGDIILSVGNTEVSDYRQFILTIDRLEEAQAIYVLVKRGEWVNYLELRKPAALGPQGEAAAPRTWGLTVSNLTVTERNELRVRGGVRVDSADGDAGRAGVRDGDIILALDGAQFVDAKQFAAAAAAKTDPKQPVTLFVRRGEWSNYIVIRPGASK